MEQTFIEKCNHDELDDVIKDYWQDVWNYSFIITKDPHLSDDITQDVFIKVFKNWNSFRKESSIKTWILKITRNTAINYLKSSYFKRISLVGFLVTTSKLCRQNKNFKQEEMNDVWKVVLKLPKSTAK